MKTTEQLLLTKLPLPAFICLPGNCWFFGLAVAPQQNKASFSFENKERQTASTERPSVLKTLIWPLLLAGSQRFSIKMENNGFFWKPTAWWICPNQPFRWIHSDAAWPSLFTKSISLHSVLSSPEDRTPLIQIKIGEIRHSMRQQHSSRLGGLWYRTSTLNDFSGIII